MTKTLDTPLFYATFLLSLVNSFVMRSVNDGRGGGNCAYMLKVVANLDICSYRVNGTKGLAISSESSISRASDSRVISGIENRRAPHSFCLKQS